MDHHPAELIMVYNADGGLFSMLSDAVHKLVSPATYPCSLCALTYGPVAMRDRWRRYLDRLPLKKRFLHRDELPAEWPRQKWPAILVRRPGAAPSTLVDHTALDACATLDDLIALVDERLLALNPPPG